MRPLYRILVISLMCAVAQAAFVPVAAQESAPPKASKLRIGILTPAITGETPEYGLKVGAILAELVRRQGGYEVLDQVALEKEFASIGSRFPRYCEDPRCVLGVGNTARLDRVIYGSFDKGPKTFGVDLTLMEVASRLIVNRVKLQTQSGGTMEELLRAAVAKLHGVQDENNNVKFHTYAGPEIHHESEMLYSTIGVTALSLFWGLGDGSLTGRDQNFASVDHDYSTLKEDLANESGVPTALNIIPLFARPAALANAYVAASDDAYGVLYNPAGLAWISHREAAVGYQYRFGMMDLMAASYVNKATREIGYGHAFVYSGDRDHLFTETQFTSAISYKVNEMPFSFLRPFSLGAAARVMSSSAKGTTASSISAGGFGLGLDWGLKWELSDEISYGLLFRDAPGFMRWVNTSTDTSYVEFQPATCLMGGTFQSGYYTFLICEAQIPLYKDQWWTMSGGIEQEFFRFLRGRVGLKKEILSPTPTGWIVTAGFGINIPLKAAGAYINIDGSYEYNQLEAFSNPVNLSMRVGF